MTVARPECVEVYRQLGKPIDDPEDLPCPADCETTRPYCECMCHGYSNDEDDDWLTQTFVKAEAMFHELPQWAWPVITRDGRYTTTPDIRVDRTALRHLLLEVQDLRARQGVEPAWADGLHPTLARELDAAIRDEAGG